VLSFILSCYEHQEPTVFQSSLVLSFPSEQTQISDNTKLVFIPSLPTYHLQHFCIQTQVTQGHLALLATFSHFFCASIWNMLLPPHPPQSKVFFCYIGIFSLLILSSPTRAVYNIVPSHPPTSTESPHKPHCTSHKP